MTSPSSFYKEKEKMFDEKFCRTNLSTGEKEDGWFFPETLTPCEVKSHIRQLSLGLLERVEKEVEENRIMIDEKTPANAKSNSWTSGVNYTVNRIVAFIKSEMEKIENEK